MEMEDERNPIESDAKRNLRRQQRVELARGLAGDLAHPLRSRQLVFRDFFSNLVTAVVAWFIGCCVAAFFLWLANGFGSLEETDWAVPVLAVAYVGIALVVLFITFTEPRR